MPEPGHDESTKPPSPWQRRLRLLTAFFSGQLIVQALNFLVGFLLLRWMSVEVFAQYSVGWAFQSTVGQLVDLGFTSSIVALVGSRTNDRSVIGKFVRSARYFRTRTFLLVFVGSMASYPLVVAAQPWGWKVKLLLLLGIAAGLAAQNLIMYASPLLIARQLKPYYTAQIAAALWRQLVFLVMYASHTLSGWAALLVSAAASAIQGGLYWRTSRTLIDEPRQVDPQANRQMLRYIAPLMPGVVFTALQSQITIAIITVFGKTNSIAEVSALGRLSQLFTLLTVFNSVLVEPYTARIDRAHLPRRYAQLLLMQLGIGGGLTLFAALFPGPLLWLIGPKYAHLRQEVLWITLTASVYYLSHCMWTIHSSRRWIYWWGTGFYIFMILATQIVAAQWLNLSTTHDVVMFGLYTSLAVLVVHIANAVYGFRFGPPVIQDDAASPGESKTD